MDSKANSSTQNIYIISGLGADERVFQRINFGNYIPVYLEWKVPSHKEDLSSYATKLIQQIPEPHPIILGISFGGIMAIEISKIIPVQKLILLASAKTHQELPFIYRFVGRTGLLSFIPSIFFKQSNLLTYHYFGLNKVSDRALLKKILNETDSHFLKWALYQITHWNNKTINVPYLHIHGTQDKIIPFNKKDQNIIPIQNGGHLMTLVQHQEISQAIAMFLISE